MQRFAPRLSRSVGLLVLFCTSINLGGLGLPAFAQRRPRGQRHAQRKTVPPPELKAGSYRVPVLPYHRTVPLDLRHTESMSVPVPQPGDGTIEIGQDVSVPHGNEIVTLKAAGLSIQEVLQTISDMKGLNMVIDPSVTGTVAVDFQDISLNSVLQTLMATNGLTLQKIGNSLIVYRTGRFGDALIQFIPVRFEPASELVTKITELIGQGGLSAAGSAVGGAAGGGATGGGASSGASGSGDSSNFSPEFKMVSDPQTNSIIVHGTKADIDLVKQLVSRLDVLMPSKIFHLTYLTPVEAISLLTNSYFVGAGTVANLVVGEGGGGAAGAAGGGAAGAAGAAGAGGAAGAVGGGVAAGGSSTPLMASEIDFAHGGQLKDTTITGSEGTPRFIPLERDSSLLVIGNKEDLALVGQVLPMLDKRPRQVLLRTQIVELDEDGQKTLGTLLNQVSPNGIGLSLSTGNGGNFTGSNLFSVNLGQGNPVASLQAAISALVNENQAKILASPTVLAMNDRTSQITATQEVLTGVTNKTTGIGQSALVTQTPIFSQVGVTLTITPRILRDNSVDLNVHPVISFPGDTVNVGGTALNEPSTREYTTQELRVANGQTLVIGGLMQDRTNENLNKIPILGDLPILGFLFSLKSTTTTRSEVQIYITPEIQPDV